MDIIVSASMLACDLSQIGSEIKRAEEGGVDWLHIDVMDGRFVPNITYGNNVIASIRKCSDIFFDTHLMVEDPTHLIPLMKEAGCDLVTIHIESKGDTAENLKAIRNLGMKSCVAVKPGTDVKECYPLLPYCDMVLVMTVEPGAGGQGFIPYCADKVKELRTYCKENGYADMKIQVDGGINATTGTLIKEAGADVLVAGTYVFRAEDISSAVSSLK